MLLLLWNLYLWQRNFGQVIKLNELMNGSNCKSQWSCLLYFNNFYVFYIWILHVLVRVIPRNFMVCMLLLSRDFFFFFYYIFSFLLGYWYFSIFFLYFIALLISKRILCGILGFSKKYFLQLITIFPFSSPAVSPLLLIYVLFH